MCHHFHSFAPAASDDIVIHDSRQSRSALLQGYTIFLLNAFDQQYLSIGTACGASVVQCVSDVIFMMCCDLVNPFVASDIRFPHADF